MAESALGVGDILATTPPALPPEVSITTDEEDRELRLSGRAEAGRTDGGGDEAEEGPRSAA